MHGSEVSTFELNNNSMLAFDHLDGFDCRLNNWFLSDVAEHGPRRVYTQYMFSDRVKKLYPNLDLRYSLPLVLNSYPMVSIINSVQPVNKTFDHFVCCFNWSSHVGRVWLVNKLRELGWFDNNSCTQNWGTRNTFLEKNKLDQVKNFVNLSPIIQKSFLHIISETKPESYYPFPTEKFYDPILNKTLWIAYAPPGYHRMIESFGFNLHKSFDYSFDSIEDPIERLDALIEQIKPLQNKQRWNQIYRSESDVISYNYKHMVSLRYVKRIIDLDETVDDDYAGHSDGDILLRQKNQLLDTLAK